MTNNISITKIIKLEQSKKKVRGFESKSHRRILNVNYKELSKQ